jgi:hypothetical protein
MTKIITNIFEITGMSDESSEIQDKTINDSILNSNTIHYHDTENNKYFVVQQKYINPIGCDTIRELNIHDKTDREMIVSILGVINEGVINDTIPANRVVH